MWNKFLITLWIEINRRFRENISAYKIEIWGLNKLPRELRNTSKLKEKAKHYESGS